MASVADLKKKLIPVREKGVELMEILKGEDKEYIDFRRNRPELMLEDIGSHLYERRSRTPHAYRFKRYNSMIDERLTVIHKTCRACWMNENTDRLVRDGKIRFTYIELPTDPNINHATWALMHGLEVVTRPPTLQELGFS